MKTVSSGSVTLSILLLACLPSRAWTQSINDIKPSRNSSLEETLSAQADSIRAEFLRNAKKINLDLIRGDYAQAENKQLRAEVTRLDEAYGVLAGELHECKTDAGELANTLFNTKDELGRQRIKKQNAKLENWLWRAALALSIYAKIKGLW